MSLLAETMLLVIAVALACALPGAFLVLRRLSLVGDAISHVLLFGIVAAYLIFRDPGSIWLYIGAAASGVLTVALVESLQRTRLLKEDAAIGLVFPALFSMGTILASLYLRGTHLDVDSVLLGHAEGLFETPLIRIGSVVLGRQPTVILFVLFAINLLFVTLFYKELKLTTFDPALAATLGFMPAVFHYSLMSLVSLTTVASFDAVGPVLVVAFLVLPPMTGLLLSSRLGWVLLVSLVIGAIGAAIGVWLAFRWNTNIAGTVAVTLGVIFTIVYLIAPRTGLLAQEIDRFRQRREFALTLLVIHLLQHEGTAQEAEESRINGLHRHLHWTSEEVLRVVRRAEKAGLVQSQDGLLRLSPTGRERARSWL
jgi:manganese/zinc/iron transport system permease protein